jgi:DnaJ-domain-containing protein 1
MENEYQNIATWERPTWKINGTKKYLDTWNSVEDQFEIRKENLKTEELIKLAKMSEDEKKARLVLGVGSSISLSSLKKHYHKLVKKHHPDTNPHEGGTHNKIKSINNAYTSLKKIIISQ